MRWGGGVQATDQAPKTCRPNATQSVVRGGLRAHTRETASLFPWGDGGPCQPALCLTPQRHAPGGFQQRVRR